MNIVDESELSLAVTAFVWSSKKHSSFHYPDGRLHVFCWLIPDTFSWVLLFRWPNCEQLLEQLCGFLEGTHNRELPSNPTVHTLSVVDEDWILVWLVVVYFTCPLISSTVHYCTVSMLSYIIVLKTEHFVTFNENWMENAERWSRRLFFFFFLFCLTYMEPKHHSN